MPQHGQADSKPEAVASHRGRRKAAELEAGELFSYCPETPCGDKHITDLVEQLGTAIQSARKAPASPSKTLSPTKLPFLTKESNLTTYTGWDVDERLNEVESQFKVMKEAMNTSLTDRKTLEDAVDIAKSRGMYSGS